MTPDAWQAASRDLRIRRERVMRNLYTDTAQSLERHYELEFHKEKRMSVDTWPARNEFEKLNALDLQLDSLGNLIRDKPWEETTREDRFQQVVSDPGLWMKLISLMAKEFFLELCDRREALARKAYDELVAEARTGSFSATHDESTVYDEFVAAQPGFVSTGDGAT